MQISLPLSEHKPWRERYSPNGEWALALVLLFEIAIFSAIGENFFTAGNFFEVIRLSVELGLLALAMTPIIITGGIDLSVGSMMALSAVVFGAAWHDAGLPIPVAALLALLTGCAGGALNAALITRLNIPPLIVTLGSFSLFRGIAEGITHGVGELFRFPVRVSLARPRLSRRHRARAVSDFSRRARRLRHLAASLRHRPHALRHRIQPQRRALRRRPRAPPSGDVIFSFRPRFERRRHHLCCAPGPGQVRRRLRL